MTTNPEYAPFPDALLQEALILRGWNWSPFPLRGNKRPRIDWTPMQRRRRTDRELDRLFHLPDVFGIGVVTGPPSSGFGNMDFDTADSYRRWAEEYPRIARVAPTIRTHRGFRVCFRSRHSAYRRHGSGELIGDGRHYVVMPPSRHPAGCNYEWVGGPPLGVSEFPLLDLVAAGFMPPNWDARDGARRAEEAANALCATPEAELPGVVRECVLRTLPSRPGQRNGMVYQFARSLRDHVPADAQPGLLHDAIFAWWKAALPAIGTKEFGVTRGDFRRAWAEVRVPMCVSRPKRVMAVAAKRESTPRAKLEAACRALAEETNGPFHLSVRTAGVVADVAFCTGARLLRDLVATGFLEVVRPGLPSATRRVATWYRIACRGADRDPANDT